MKFYAFILLIIIGCNSNNETPVRVKKVVKKVVKTVTPPKPITKVVQPPRPKPVKLPPPTPYELATYEKMRKINSGSQFLRWYFTTGSTAQQVRKVQGMPDDKVNLGNLTETWFYGNCEITIYNNRVTKVETQNDCLNYINVKICLLSSDEIVRQNIMKVIDETSNIYQ